MDVHLEMNNVSFGYDSKSKVLKNFNLEVFEGEFVCLLGESGCGKSTVMRLLTGLEQSEEGYVKIDSEVVSRPRSSTGIVFQSPSLIPWLTVRGNLALGYKLRNETILEDDIENVLEIVGIKDFGDLKPNELSGGMAQRVSIARALIGGSNPLLMDEPFGALDALTRMRLQNELSTIWNENSKTILFVTHDIDEAVFLSDRIVIMNDGEIAEIIEINMARPRDRSSINYIKKHLEVKNKLFNLINSIDNG